ncbi:MAG: ABC transporter ATP-binding protein [Afipia sp.]|nr:ABC transporter ATP-binding protein [Afipia sp.]
MKTGGSVILSIENIEVIYQRAITALHSVSLKVAEGQITALLGANGAGKTTTLRAISGFIGLDNARVSRGNITYRGCSIANWRPDQVARLGVRLVPEREKVFPSLTVRENLEAVASHGISRARQSELVGLVFDTFPRLVTHSRKSAGLLSGGERQMLAIGAAIVSAPQLLLVDELSLGLAPVIVEEIAARLVALRKEINLTILLVEQSASVALKIADYAYVLENGRVSIAGPASDLRQDPSVQNAYLGQGPSGAERRNYRKIAIARGALIGEGSEA